MKDFVSLHAVSRAWLDEVLDLAVAVKAQPEDYARAMHRRTLFMVFEKPSLRTRVSFEIGMNQMGGHAIYYDFANSPIGAGKETLHDTVKSVSRYSDFIMARLFEHEKLLQMAAFADVPVINGLTNFNHPCQIVADLLTIRERKGTLAGVKLAYLGDGNNNVTHSLLYGCARAGMSVAVGCPAAEAYAPLPEVVQQATATAAETGATVEVVDDALAAARGADVVYTDSWMSYHISKDQADARKADLLPFQVNREVMASAGPDAVFMNCLPAERGCEQSAEVIDGPQSIVFDQAENRLHAQKAILLKLLDAR